MCSVYGTSYYSVWQLEYLYSQEWNVDMYKVNISYNYNFKVC